MSTTPTIFNRGLNPAVPSYTTVGGTGGSLSTGISAVLLNRGGRYPRRTLFQELEKTGFDTIVSVEGPQERYDLEELSGRFPQVRFILLKESINAGEAVNLAALELSNPLFFVVWNDQRVFNGGGAARYSSLFLDRAAGGFFDSRLCALPVIQNSNFECLPTLTSPFYDRGSLRTLPEIPKREKQLSLYPWDYVGLYDRRRFLRLGGFDGDIASPYWQLLDFGFRARLWGETIRSTQHIHIVYDGETPPEDGTVDASYRLFYLKNIAPVFRGGAAHLPLRRFPGYLAQSGWDIITAWTEFSRERRWVDENRNRFTRDARSLVDLWENGGEEP